MSLLVGTAGLCKTANFSCPCNDRVKFSRTITGQYRNLKSVPAGNAAVSDLVFDASIDLSKIGNEVFWYLRRIGFTDKNHSQHLTFDDTAADGVVERISSHDLAMRG